jgi:hypothetical protein
MKESRCITFLLILLGISIIIPHPIPIIEPIEEIEYMTAHSEMIKKLITCESGYEGNIYPSIQSVDEVNETAPKFIVYYEPEKDMNDNTMQSETFKVVFKSDTEANLDVIKSTILGLSSNCNGGYLGYNAAISTTIPVYSSYNYLWHSVDGVSDTFTKEGSQSPLKLESRVSEDIENILCNFKTSNRLNGFTIQTAKIRLTPASTLTVEDDLVIVIACYDLSNQDINEAVILYVPTLTTLGTGREQHSDNCDSWIINTAQDFEAIKDGGWTNIDPTTTEYFVVEIKAWRPGATPTTQEYTLASNPELVITATPPSTYPYWIDVHGGKKYYDSQNFYIEFEIEARWAL